MPVRIESLAFGIDWGQAGLFKGRQELAQGDLHAGSHLLGRCRRRGERGLEAVNHGNQRFGKIFDRVLVRLRDVFLSTAPDIFHLGLRPQVGLVVLRHAGLRLNERGRVGRKMEIGAIHQAGNGVGPDSSSGGRICKRRRGGWL